MGARLKSGDGNAERARRVEMGRRIEAAREKLGLLKKEMAAEMGVSASAYTGWIKGDHSMTHAHLTRLVELTGEPSSFFTPEPFAKKGTLERLSRSLGARLGHARVERLLEIPEPTLRKEIDAVIGSHLVGKPARRKRG